MTERSLLCNPASGGLYLLLVLLEVLRARFAAEVDGAVRRLAVRRLLDDLEDDSADGAVRLLAERLARLLGDSGRPAGGAGASASGAAVEARVGGFPRLNVVRGERRFVVLLAGGQQQQA